MAGIRKGQCPECPHEILTPADLKLFRSVCGYSFGPELDPFARRGFLPVAAAGMVELCCLTMLSAVLAALSAYAGWSLHWAFWPLALVFVLLGGFVISFFRDPEREVPSDTTAVVSPADGTVTHVEEVSEPDLGEGKFLRVSIFLSVFDVHVNRAPRDATITRIQYFPGAFQDARSQACSAANEQLWVDLLDKATGGPMRVKQIAGAIARRIVCWVKPGEALARGSRFGMIKFGSRTDLLVPASAVQQICIKVGDKVYGAITVLLRLR